MNSSAYRRAVVQAALLEFGLSTLFAIPVSAEVTSAKQVIPSCAGTTYSSAKRAQALAKESAAQKAAALRPTAMGAANTQRAQLDSGHQNVDTSITPKRAALAKGTLGSDAPQPPKPEDAYDAIRDVPGGLTGGASVGEYMRGIKLSETTGYRLDGGLPYLFTIDMPAEDKCRVERIHGVGALQYGLASHPGIVNFVFKRAGDVPNKSLTLAMTDFGLKVGSADFGTRFGGSNQFGVRVNLIGGNYRSFMRGAAATRYLAALTGDWTPSERASVQLDFEQFWIDWAEQSKLLLLPAVNNVVTVPRVPDPTKLLSAPWARAIGTVRNVFLHTRYDLGSGWTVVGEAGQSKVHRTQRAEARIKNYDVVTGAGTETFSLLDNLVQANNYLDVHLKHHLQSSIFANDVSVGVTRNWRDFNGPQNPTVSYPQNIYDPVVLPEPSRPLSVKELPNNSRDVSYYVSDAVSVGRLHVLGGARDINFTSDSVATDGKLHTSRQAVLVPAFGFVYDLNRAVSVYARYGQSFEVADRAPVNAANAYDVPPPARAMQREIGVRTTGPRVSTSIEYFTLNRANATLDPVTNIYGLNGRTKFEGLESSVSVKLQPRLTFSTVAHLLRAPQDSVSPSINGKMVENTPNFAGFAGFAYRPDPNGGLGFNAGVSSFGRRWVNPQNQATTPGVITVNAGMNYIARMNGHHYTFNLNCSNLLNKRYFSVIEAGAYEVAPPRIITLTSRIDL